MGERGTCRICNERPCASNGRGKFRTVCGPCNSGMEPDEYRRVKQLSWRTRRTAKYKKPYCELCGFVAVHTCQLDVDHKDGNRKNNNPDNYQTLCANCHRLKTLQNRDHLRTYG